MEFTANYPKSVCKFALIHAKIKAYLWNFFFTVYISATHRPFKRVYETKIQSTEATEFKPKI